MCEATLAIEQRKNTTEKKISPNISKDNDAIASEMLDFIRIERMDSLLISFTNSRKE